MEAYFDNILDRLEEIINEHASAMHLDDVDRLYIESETIGA